MTSSREREWVATMRGHRSGDAVVAHHERPVPVTARLVDRLEREAAESTGLAVGATRAEGPGRRERPEEPDPLRTCFEQDRDRILHSTAFRRLAGKTQVFVFPADHQRTRLTHALEVAQVAAAMSRALGLNVALTEAIALGHDCGHGPGGHASEDAFDPYVPGGYHHAIWGADVVLARLNLCAETLDGIRHHSWSLPTPLTPEGEVVSWADRCAYSCHDLEDAVSAGIVAADELPSSVTEILGVSRSAQLNTLIGALIASTLEHGRVSMDQDRAGALADLRAFNYERIYRRPASLDQSRAVIAVLGALVEHFAAHPEDLPEDDRGGPDVMAAAVEYVAGMTDRFAFNTAIRLLDWPLEDLPRGIDSPGPTPLRP